MSRLWTEHELRALHQVAGAGVALEEVWRRFCHFPGTRTRTLQAVQGMLTLRGIRYGKHRYIPWADDETRLLYELAGRATVAQISAQLLAECGTHRSVNAVRARLWLIDRSCWPDRSAYLTSGDVGHALGMGVSTVLLQISLGRLQAHVEGSEKCRRFRIRPADVEAFIDAHPLLLDLERMPPGPFRSRVELLRRQGRWLTTEQVAALSGRHRLTVIDACRLGRLRAIRTRPIGRQGTPRWWIRAADAARWAAAVGDRTKKIGNRAVAGPLFPTSYFLSPAERAS